jgi:hypothetical protein
MARTNDRLYNIRTALTNYSAEGENIEIGYVCSILRSSLPYFEKAESVPEDNFRTKSIARASESRTLV